MEEEERKRGREGRRGGERKGWQKILSLLGHG